MSSSDRILVRDLRLWAHVGVLPHERELGQWFELDIELGWDLSAAAAADDVGATLTTAVPSQPCRARPAPCVVRPWSTGVV